MFPFTSKRRANYRVIDGDEEAESSASDFGPISSPAPIDSGSELGSLHPVDFSGSARELLPLRLGTNRLGTPGDNGTEEDGEEEEADSPVTGTEEDLTGGIPPASHEVLQVSFRQPTSRAASAASHHGLGGSNCSASGLSRKTSGGSGGRHPASASGSLLHSTALSHRRNKSAHSSEHSLTASASTKHRWEHMGDIDAFFQLLYEYHQGSGLMCIALRHAFALFQFAFVVAFTTFLTQCVDYEVLFANKNVTASGLPIPGGRKRHIADSMIPQCYAHLSPLYVLALLLAFLFWLVHFARVSYRLLQLVETRHFYVSALQIADSELASCSWSEVVERVCRLQPDIRLIINQDRITPLDIYQRILRFKNYFVAMVHLDLLPPRLVLPFASTATVPYLSNGLRLNLEWLLFWGAWAPWRSAYALHEEYRESANLELLAAKLQRSLAWAALVNLVLSPAIFLYQILFSFFHYADLLKREPGVFGTRKYSNYGKEKLRHFNELDHELASRLNRSYEFAVRYMDQFVSPTAEIIAKCVAFTFGSVFAVLALLSAWDEDVLSVEHVLTAMTLCGGVVMVCRSFIADENLVLCQEFLMRHVLANIHYAPRTWLARAAAPEVCRDFAQLFQLKAQFLAEELLSPLVTPYVLYFHIRPRASELVHFFHTYTRHVDGLGDVCSLALMNIGDSRLQRSMTAPSQSSTEQPQAAQHNSPFTEGDPKSSGTLLPSNDGKVELSLLNFATQQPSWEPPAAATDFIRSVRQIALVEQQQPFVTTTAAGRLRDLIESTAATLLRCELQQESAFGVEGIGNSLQQSRIRGEGDDGELHTPQGQQLQGSVAGPPTSFFARPDRIRMRDQRAMEMSFNALALNRMLASGEYDGTASTTESITASSSHQPLMSYLRHPSTTTTMPAPLGLASRYGTATGYYGTLMGASSSGSVVASRYLPSMTATAGGGGGNPNIAQSNIWGVPEMSVLLNETQSQSRLFNAMADERGSRTAR